MMRLLFLTNLYPPNDPGGLEQVCYEVATALTARGHTVQVLTSRDGRAAQDHAEPGVTRSLYLQADLDYYQPLDFLTKHAVRERSNRAELRKAIAATQPDVLVVWGMWDLSPELAWRAEQWLPGRVAYYLASYWPMEPDVHERYWQLPANSAIGKALKWPVSAVVTPILRRERRSRAPELQHSRCCSRYVRDTLVASGALPESAGIIYLGIDPSFDVRPVQAGGSGRLRLLYFGSLFPHKGVHTAIEALGLLKAGGLIDGVDLTLLGSGHPDYEEHLRRMVTEQGLENLVHFVPRVPRNEVPGWLARSDVFLFTSTWAEPMARTVMEAMAAGLLVIGSDVGGQTEMLAHGENALTYQPGDASGLASRIAEAAADPARRERLAQAGQQMVHERFTLYRMVDDLEEWLEQLSS